MSLTRQQVCDLTNKRLSAAASTISSVKTLVGLDGFVDNIISVVDKRHDLETFDRVRTIDHLGQKIRNAAGQSSNYELVVTQQKLGGNGPIMANALSAIALVGSIVILGQTETTYAKILGFIAVVCSTINVVGGFIITKRMLAMFKRSDRKQVESTKA